MFTATVFTVAKGLPQPKCPSKDEWITTSGTCTQWMLFNLKKKGNSDAHYDMDEP